MGFSCRRCPWVGFPGKWGSLCGPVRMKRFSLVDRAVQAKVSWVPNLLSSGPASFPPTAQSLDRYQLYLTDGETGSKRLRDSPRVTKALSGLYPGSVIFSGS